MVFVVVPSVFPAFCFPAEARNDFLDAAVATRTGHIQMPPFRQPGVNAFLVKTMPTRNDNFRATSESFVIITRQGVRADGRCEDDEMSPSWYQDRKTAMTLDQVNQPNSLQSV
jgi:hypothetical protein